MPSIWQVPLSVPRPADVRLEHIHAVVSGWLDPQDDAGHHDHHRPFTITPLHRSEMGEVTLQVTLLDDDAALRRRLVLATERSAGDGIALGRQRARILPTGRDHAVCVASVSWTSLAEAAQPLEEVVLSFATPVAFRHGSDWDPLPAPSLVFGHLRRRWQQFATTLAPAINFRDAGLRTTRIEGRSESLTVRRRRVVGFIGDVGYCVKADREAQRALHQLALAAPYCGVGAGTTFGMGVCELL